MSHVALYRKYRSQTFDELVGQSHVTRTLQQAFNRGAIHHAYLFTGPRGTGKTSTARLLAKALNCVNGPTGSPCGHCDICTSIANGTCMDVIEMDAASEAGVDDVREKIVEVVQYRPALCRYKVFIIDEVHDLSAKAFDALLKTIEEPPKHIVFVLATTELHAVPPTIQSRCQKFMFNRANLSDLSGRLEFVLQSEGRDFDPAAVQVIARMSDGGFRDALSLLEQLLVLTDEKITLDLVYGQLGLIHDDEIDALIHAVVNHDPKAILEKSDAIYGSGRDAKTILEAMIMRLGDLSRAAFQQASSGDASQEATMRAKAAEIGPESILRLREKVAVWLRDLRDVSLPMTWLESMFLGYGLQPKPVPVASAPTPSAQVMEPRAVVTAVSEPVPTKPKPEPQSPPARKPAAPTGDAELDKMRAHWDVVVQKMSMKSRAAKEKLAGSELVGIREDTLIIQFSRQVFRDWVLERDGVMPMLRQLFAEECPGKYVFEMIAAAPTKASSASEPAVELPAEGKKAQEIIKKEFEDF